MARPGRSSPPQPSIEIVADDRGFSDLKSDWERLWAASARQEPMLSHLWISGWWRHFRNDRTLSVGVIRIGREVVGIAPCCIRTFRYRGFLPFRRLELMGAEEGEDDGITSEYIGLLSAPGYEAVVAATFAAAVIGKTFGDFDECVLERMNGEDELIAFIENAFERLGRPVALDTLSMAPHVKLPEDWDTYLKSLPKKRRGSLTRSLRDLEAWAGADGYQLCRSDDRASFERAFDIVARLHGERWQDSAHGGSFAKPKFSRFHREHGWSLAQAGLLDVVWLEVADEPLAALYLLQSNGRIQFYQSGRRLDVPRQIRPSIVTLALAIKDAIARGYTEFDFLGNAVPYKTGFARSFRPIVRLRYAPPSGRESVRKSLVHIRDFVRRRRNQATIAVAADSTDAASDASAAAASAN